MSSAKLTLYGIYSWLKSHDVDMFEAFKQLPEDIDKGTLENVILSEGGEFECVYANAEMMKAQVEIFVSNHLRTFTKWVEALNIEYDPLENYDRREDWTDKTHAKSNGDINGGGSSTGNVSAYDSNGFVPHDQSISQTNSHTDSEGNSDSEHHGRTHGNIGVVSSQQMLTQELDVARFNIYHQICDLFIDELLIGVYV